MPKELINPPELADVLARGFAHAVRAGNRVYISGQVARNRDGTVYAPGDFAAQADKVFEQLQIILAAVGATFANVVKMNSYLVDPAHFRAFREARSKWLGDNTPVSTAVIVSGLAGPELLLEVELVADLS